jgi:cobalt-zinc-cadmium efflux system outer membrane protein
MIAGFLMIRRCLLAMSIIMLAAVGQAQVHVAIAQPAPGAPTLSAPPAQNDLRLLPANPPTPADPKSSAATPEPVARPQDNRPNGPPAAFTLQDLESIALANNPTLVQAGAQVQAARGAWIQAGLYPNPRIAFEGSEIGNEGNAGQLGASVAQEIVTKGKLQLDRAVVSREIAQLQWQYDSQRLRVLNDVRSEFYNVLIAQRTIELTQSLETDAASRIRIAEKGVESGELSRLDVLQRRLDHDAMILARQRSENRYSSAWRRLVGVAGIPLTPPTPLIGDVEAAIPDYRWDEVLTRLLTNSPEMSAARLAVDRASFAVARAQVEPFPNLDVRAGVQHDNNSGDDIATVDVAIPVPVFNRNQGNIRRAEAELQAARAEVARVELMLHNRLAAVFERFSNARQQLQRYTEAMRGRIEESQVLIRRARERGGVLSQLDERFLLLTFRQIELARLEALREAWENSVAIEGLLLTDSLQAGLAGAVPPISIGPGGVPRGETMFPGFSGNAR